MPKPARNRCDVNAELREVIAQGAPWVRRTEFVPMADGSLRRRITRHDGTVEMDEVIDTARVPVAEARASTGLSQAAAPLASCIVWLYISPMIRSFRHKGVEAFFRTGATRDIQAKNGKRLRLQLGRLEVARWPNDMAAPGWRLHPLKGRLAGLGGQSLAADVSVPAWRRGAGGLSGLSLRATP